MGLPIRIISLGWFSLIFILPCGHGSRSDSFDFTDQSNLDLVISAGGLHTCFVNSTKLVCWCENEPGNCEPPHGYFKGVSSGSWHSCAITANSVLKCFGSGYALNTPPPSESVATVSSGFATTCAVLRSNSTLSCWGFGVDQSQVPTGRFVAVSVGTRSACAIRSEDSSIICWGADEFGQVSNRPSGPHSAVSCGGGHCCAVHADGGAVCWGGSDYFAGGRPMPALTGRLLQVSAGLLLIRG